MKEKMRIHLRPFRDPSKFCFKKCVHVDGYLLHEFLVVLEKPDGFVSNEHRQSVVNWEFAKFRGNILTPRLIVNLQNCECQSVVWHRSAFKEISYEVDKPVIPDAYDTNVYAICSNGIHYFLTSKAAINYDVMFAQCRVGSIAYDADGAAMPFFRPIALQSTFGKPNNSRTGGCTMKLPRVFIPTCVSRLTVPKLQAKFVHQPKQRAFQPRYIGCKRL